MQYIKVDTKSPTELDIFRRKSPFSWTFGPGELKKQLCSRLIKNKWALTLRFYILMYLSIFAISKRERVQILLRRDEHYVIKFVSDLRQVGMAARANNMLWLAEISKIFFSETNELTVPKL
jgi:hypothetical protein